jgi:hypothetical protein
MKTIFTLLSLFLFVGAGFTFTSSTENSLTEDFIFGDPQVKSVNALTFGPEGILFIGDSDQAAIIAVDTKDNASMEIPASVDLKNIDEQIAALVGTTPDDIIIQDMAVNPLSKKIYLAIHRQDGLPMLLTTNGTKLDHFPLDKVSYSKSVLEKAVSEDAKDRRGRSLRKWAISDLAYYGDQVMVSGLANEAFSSAFHAISFPFREEPELSTLEIYHAAHGRYETYAPIKTFMPYEMMGKSYLVASYTCTPLVIFPMDELKPGEHTKGKTVAELGNRNTPLDIISIKKDGKDFLLLANSSRALMRIDPHKIASYDAYLTEPVEGNSATAGVEFVALPYVNVLQMDKMSDDKVVMLQRTADGDLNLHMQDAGRL